MKKILIILGFLLILGLSKAEANYGSRISFNYFYSSLSPYGEWIEVDYDLFAWKPYRVGNGWAPYTMGRWEWTRDGWYWDSYEPFGWATYHYGRWHYDDYYGWIWVPDYDWGPAWVEWRYDDDYIGWAPLPPYAVFSVNFGIRFSTDWHFPYHHWHYVNYNHFCGNDVYNYFIPDRQKYRIHSRTKYRDEYDYRDGRVINRGVDKDFVERRSGNRISERELVNTTRLRDADGSRSRDRNRIEVYKPGDDEIKRTQNIDRFEIKKADRKVNLDVNKVSSRTITSKERERINISRNDNEKEKRNTLDSRNERSNRNTGTEKIEKRNTENEIQKRVNTDRNVIERKRNENNESISKQVERKNEQMQIERKNTEQKRNVEQRVNRNTEERQSRNSEVRERKNENNQSRTFEKRNTESRSRNTESKSSGNNRRR